MRVPSFLSTCNPATDAPSAPLNEGGISTTGSSLKSSLSMAKMREAFSFPLLSTPKFPGAKIYPYSMRQTHSQSERAP
jgi:hypothetical protein